MPTNGQSKPVLVGILLPANIHPLENNMDVWILPAGLGLVVIVIFLMLVLASGNSPKKVDNREPYFRNAAGNIWAIKVGPDTAHQEFIHDGTAHQNPAMVDEIRWWFIFSYSVEVSYYPLTINGRLTPDVEAIGVTVELAQRRGKDVQLVTLSKELERQVIRRENGGQLAAGVQAKALTHDLNGRRK